MYLYKDNMTGEANNPPKKSFVKAFFVKDTQVIVYIDFDIDEDTASIFTITYLKGTTYTSETVYPSLEDMFNAFEAFTEEDAVVFVDNTDTHGSAPPISDLSPLRELDFDSFCNWVEEQHPHNLSMYRGIMEGYEDFSSQLSVMDYYIKKNTAE